MFPFAPPVPGPIIVDLTGTSLTSEEREFLKSPVIGGVILFSRNYESPEQITELCREIRECYYMPRLILVDQEGGRVQRFKEGFVELPSMGILGKIYKKRSKEDAIRMAYCTGYIMAAELLAVGVDMSLAPVLDMNYDINPMIGDRSFGWEPEIVTILAKMVMEGMHDAGMASTGKHFPGHGGVQEDSHHTLPSDRRTYVRVYRDEMTPFIDLVAAGIDAIMPGHILFPGVDTDAVCYSYFWLKDALRRQLNFQGMIISDDLNMGGAEREGDYVSRAVRALNAGCDMVMICNNRPAAIEIVKKLPVGYGIAQKKYDSLKGKFTQSRESLYSSEAWKKSHDSFLSLKEIYEGYQ